MRGRVRRRLALCVAVCVSVCVRVCVCVCWDRPLRQGPCLLSVHIWPCHGWAVLCIAHTSCAVRDVTSPSSSFSSPSSSQVKCLYSSGVSGHYARRPSQLISMAKTAKGSLTLAGGRTFYIITPLTAAACLCLGGARQGRTLILGGIVRPYRSGICAQFGRKNFPLPKVFEHGTPSSIPFDSEAHSAVFLTTCLHVLWNAGIRHLFPAHLLFLFNWCCADPALQGGGGRWRPVKGGFWPYTFCLDHRLDRDSLRRYPRRNLYGSVKTRFNFPYHHTAHKTKPVQDKNVKFQIPF